MVNILRSDDLIVLNGLVNRVYFVCQIEELNGILSEHGSHSVIDPVESMVPVYRHCLCLTFLFNPV